MATITSAATGNFSAGATWSGGVVPGAADDAVVATGHTVTIDTDTTVLSIQSSGGVFRISNGVTLTCTATDGVKGPSAGSNPTLGFNLGAGNSATVVGNVRGSTAVNVATIRLDNVGTLNITGDVTATTTLSLNGTLATNAAGRYVVTGNITGGTTSNSHAIYITSTNSRVDITGTVTGGSAPAIAAIRHAASATLNVTGNITGAGAEAVFLTSAAALFDVTGTVTASTASPALATETSVTTPPIVAGNLIDASNGICAARVHSIAIRTTANGNYTDHRSSAGGAARVIRGDSTYWSTGVDGLAPANVRSGTAYGSGNALTGTLRVPDPQSVLFGVPTDATVGTASIVRDPWLSPL